MPDQQLAQTIEPQVFSTNSFQSDSIQTQFTKTKQELPRIPISWYQVAWTHELPLRGVKSVILGGKHLVLFRGEDGAPRALDAHCPHLGAHLGVKGKVCGNHIKCAFHGWEFDGTGACKKIPTSERITSRTSTRSWAVTEKYGIVFVYFDPEGTTTPSEFPRVDVLEHGDWGKPVGKGHRIHARQSEILENGVDTGHFFFVHRVPMNGAVLEEQADGTLRFKHRTITRRCGVSFNTMLEIGFYIPGLQLIHLESVLGTECVALSSVTPVEDGTVIAHLTVRIRKGFFPPLTHLLTRILAYFINDTFAEDIPIWDHKVFKNQPVLVRGDENIAKFRHWYQKYPAGA